MQSCKCPECSRANAVEARFCSYCGVALRVPVSVRRYQSFMSSIEDVRSELVLTPHTEVLRRVAYLFELVQLGLQALPPVKAEVGPGELAFRQFLTLLKVELSICQARLLRQKVTVNILKP